MSMGSRVTELKKKHAHLSTSVEKLQRSPASDDLEIARLKKEKLHIKEEISRLSTQIA